MATGAGNCWAELLHDGRLRALVSGRDADNRSRIGEVFFNANTLELLEIAPNPLIALGERGLFDFNGTSYPWLVSDSDAEYLYYTGWTIGAHTPFINDPGLAIKQKGKADFSKVSRAGIFARTNEEPFGTGSMCVLKEADGWKMYYTTFTHWGKDENDHPHYYHIRYASSNDGLHWNRTGKVCVDYDTSNGEYVTARPCVIRYKGLYLMWFSYRGDYYRIGFAVSADGLNWTRHTQVLGLDVSPTGWDSEMVSYGFVYQHKEQLFMLYSGNGFGRSGLGAAVMQTGELDAVLTNLGYPLKA
jgi:hypothetical protein